MWSLPLALFFPWLSFGAAEPFICQPGFAALLHPSQKNALAGGWQNQAVTRERLRAVVEHQNKLRAQKNAPELSTEEFSHAARDQRVEINIGIPNGYDGDESTVGRFLAFKDLLIRGMYGDHLALNYVYAFRGPKLLEAKPYAEWYLERFRGKTIRLYRQMSPQEHALWERGALDQLGSEDWQPGKRVVHLSTDRSFTSAAQPASAPTIEIQIQKEALLKLARKEGVRTGILEETKLISEFVLTTEQIKALRDAGNLSILAK